jgi:hypothetical protein
MKRYHLTIFGYYTRADSTHRTTITCDGVSSFNEGYYAFWEREENGGSKPIAFYPIRNTIITYIEHINKEQ